MTIMVGIREFEFFFNFVNKRASKSAFNLENIRLEKIREIFFPLRLFSSFLMRLFSSFPLRLFSSFLLRIFSSILLRLFSIMRLCKQRFELSKVR